MAEKIPKVKHIDKMDNETFLKHMNARHKGAAGLQHFGPSNVPGDRTEERLLRAMHKALHGNPKNYGPFNHTHGEADDDGS